MDTLLLDSIHMEKFYMCGCKYSELDITVQTKLKRVVRSFFTITHSDQ